MEGEESEFEVVVAAVAIGSALEQADLVVGAFQWAGGDRVVVPVEQADAMAAQGVAAWCGGRGYWWPRRGGTSRRGTSPQRTWSLTARTVAIRL